MTRELRYRIVDVFTDRPLAGNGLCVVLDECPPELMGPLAREVNLSETTFPIVTASGEYDVRIFTPSLEMPYAGHPTLGTAWTLGPGRWTQTSPGTTVVVETDRDGAHMTQPAPTFTAWDATDVGRALGLPAADGCWVAEAGGLRHLVVLTPAPIDALAPDLSALVAAGRAATTTTIGVVARHDDGALHVRVFAPGAGVTEDPGTGSAAGPIAVLARQQWRTAAEVTIRQGDEIGRPCRIEVTVPDEGGPIVGGRIVSCAEGRFTL